ncbi:MAG: leucyl aminopeptidase [Chloroflexi bacterium]|nr:MAG: leucyl aminopeptidase [Chloroflexota bacterium]
MAPASDPHGDRADPEAGAWNDPALRREHAARRSAHRPRRSREAGRARRRTRAQYRERGDPRALAIVSAQSRHRRSARRAHQCARGAGERRGGDLRDVAARGSPDALGRAASSGDRHGDARRRGRAEGGDRPRRRDRYLSVAQGSHEPPQFIVMRHKGRGGSGYDLGLVGKGITFDSGGISIKPADNMHHMKADMTGAASVIAALAAIGKLGVKANVIAVAPCTENLPGGGATKPGDVFTAMSGRTVEVINTDAEGRLVLVDGISYAQREGATRVVDVATLTGAIAVALGNHFTGLFGKPASFVETVRATGAEAGDRLWPMPLTDEYREEIKGEVADIRNSAGREGGAIKAAAFLDSAVEDGTEWAHLDIAGTFWFDRDRSHAPKGPQGPIVRTLVALAERYARG